MTFVHLSVIAAVFYFSVYKVIGRHISNIYLFEVNSRNAKKRCEMWPKLTINIVESRSGAFIVNFEHISHFFTDNVIITIILYIHIYIYIYIYIYIFIYIIQETNS